MSGSQGLSKELHPFLYAYTYCIVRAKRKISEFDQISNVDLASLIKAGHWSSVTIK